MQGLNDPASVPQPVVKLFVVAVDYEVLPSIIIRRFRYFYSVIQDKLLAKKQCCDKGFVHVG
jgi:hypothetical protein